MFPWAFRRRGCDAHQWHNTCRQRLDDLMMPLLLLSFPPLFSGLGSISLAVALFPRQSTIPPTP